LRRNPGWVDGHDALCRLRWQSGDHEGFADTLEATLRRYPGDLRLWQLIIVILSQRDLNARMLEMVQRGQASAGDHLIFTANEAVARAELGQVAEADRLFERLRDVDDPTLRVRWVRHLLRSGRAGQGAELAYAMAQGPAGFLFWPYVSVAWRLLGDRRWEWLEGDERLVGVYDLSDRLAPLAGLAERLRGLHLASSEPLEQSVRGGTQTDGPLLSRREPEIRSLRAAIIDTVQEHVSGLPPVDPAHPVLRHRRDAPIRIAGSWSVRLTGAGFHTNHIHPQGWFSSALYIAVPGDEQRGPAARRVAFLGRSPTGARGRTAPLARSGAQAGPACAVPVDNVARDPAVRGGRTAHLRIRRGAAPLIRRAGNRGLLLSLIRGSAPAAPRLPPRAPPCPSRTSPRSRASASGSCRCFCTARFSGRAP
jgi:hypothetical protein